MIIFTTNTSVFMLPLLLAIWAVDIYLLLAAIRIVLPWIRGDPPRRWCRAIERFTDPIPLALHQWLARRRTTPIPNWVPWLIVIISCLVLRHLLIAIVLQTL